VSRPAAEGLAGPALLYAGAPLALPRPLAELPGALVQALEPLDPLGHVARPLGPGVLSLDERLWFVLPRCYRPPPGGEAPGAEAMLLTLSVLARYRRERPQGAVLRRQDPLALVEAGEPGGALDHLEAGLALWADWRERGPLVLARARRSAVEPGRTHWPATVRSGQPVGSGGQIFARQIRTRVRPDPQNELARLHLSTVAEAARALGAPGPRPPAEPGAPPLAILQRWRERCFADRQRRVLSLLERYHRPAGAGRLQGRDRVWGLFAPEFEFVWERMLAVALGHEPARQGLTGRYRLPGGALAPGLELRPDILVRLADPPGLLVLDAKQYDYGSWPQTADLTKQILYRLLLSDRLQGDVPLGRIGNAFLFPSRRLPDGQPVGLRGVHDLEHGSDPERPGRVVGLDVDFERAARAYLTGRRDQGLRRQVAAAVMREMAIGGAVL
jgi:hypothetical protein